MPLLENVAVLDEPAQHNLPWAVRFPRASDHWSRACLQALRLCTGNSRKKWLGRRAAAPTAASEQARNMAQHCLEPRAGKIPAGFCTFFTSMWEHAREVPPACLAPPGWSGPLRLFAQPVLWDVIARGKMLGILSCNCPKHVLPLEIRLEPRPCHPSIRACAPLANIYYTTNPLV